MIVYQKKLTVDCVPEKDYYVYCVAKKVKG